MIVTVHSVLSNTLRDANASLRDANVSLRDANASLRDANASLHDALKLQKDVILRFKTSQNHASSMILASRNATCEQ